jgi:hypothetical protein
MANTHQRSSEQLLRLPNNQQHLSYQTAKDRVSCMKIHTVPHYEVKINYGSTYEEKILRQSIIISLH